MRICGLTGSLPKKSSTKNTYHGLPMPAPEEKPEDDFNTAALANCAVYFDNDDCAGALIRDNAVNELRRMRSELENQRLEIARISEEKALDWKAACETARLASAEMSDAHQHLKALRRKLEELGVVEPFQPKQEGPTHDKTDKT